MATTKCGFNDAPDGLQSGRESLRLNGPTLAARIGFDPKYDPKGTAVPNLADTRWWTLVDTGASSSCIDSDLAIELDLPMIDQAFGQGVDGPFKANVFAAQVHVPSLNFTIWGTFMGVNLKGFWNCRALMGRDFLSGFTMTYEGRTGSVILSND